MPTLSDYQALLFDVDKTLTNSARIVSPRVIAALRQLQERGITAGVCTARPICSLKEKVFPFFSPNSRHVVSGGGQVVDALGQVVWEQLIPAEIAQIIAQKANDYHSGVHVPQGDFSFANQRVITEYTNVNPLVPTFKPLAELTDYRVPLVIVWDTNEEFVNFLGEIDEINAKQMRVGRDKVYVDVTAKHINKSAGLKKWSEITGIAPEHIIGFGDSENDDEFLASVGFSVAMGNATEYLKANANRVIGDTDQDGLAIYLESILKGDSL
jgi:Cof subfamily protein (haloacid dehalogenase superfamily)